jgi:hypothetical protein
MGSLDKQHRKSQLKTSGLDLWNWCTRQKRDEVEEQLPVHDRFFMLVRVLAFVMLVWAQPKDDNRLQTIMRYGTMAIKTAKSCICKSDSKLSSDTLAHDTLSQR